MLPVRRTWGGRRVWTARFLRTHCETGFLCNRQELIEVYENSSKCSSFLFFFVHLLRKQVKENVPRRLRLTLNRALNTVAYTNPFFFFFRVL